MADILDAAQSNTPASPLGGQPPPSAMPVDPPPPPANEPPVVPEPPATNSDSLIIPPPETPAPEPTISSTPPVPPPPEEPKREEVKPFEKPKKKSRIGVLLAGLLLLVIMLPIMVVFVRQQVEIRSRATEGVYPCDSTRNQYASLITSCLTVPTCNASTGVWKCPPTCDATRNQYASVITSCLTVPTCDASTGVWKCPPTCDATRNQYASVITSCLTVPTCDANTGVWTCPAGVAGKSCITYEGWPGTCTVNDAAHCNSVAAGIAWDNNVATCRTSSAPYYGCCGIKPATTPTTLPACNKCVGTTCQSVSLSTQCNSALDTCNPRVPGVCGTAVLPACNKCVGTTCTSVPLSQQCNASLDKCSPRVPGSCTTTTPIITPRTTTTPIITPRTTPTCTATKPTCPNNVAPVCTGITWSCPSVGPAGTWACGGGTGVEPAIGTQCINGGDTYQGKCAVYHCPNGCAGSTCGETSPNVRIEFVSCSSASLASGECGQIDTVTNANRYCQPQSGCDVKAINCSGSCASGTPVTPPTAPQCINNIVAYKNGNALSPSELAALQPNDVITLAFAPGGAATKVRFRVNSSSDADWWETTTRHPNNNAQFMLNYSLANTTSFTIEAQWFDGTAWH